MRRDPRFEDCECGSETFQIKVIPFGQCGTDHLFICADCGKSTGGVISDPLEEWNENSLRPKMMKDEKN